MHKMKSMKFNLQCMNFMLLVLLLIMDHIWASEEDQKAHTIYNKQQPPNAKGDFLSEFQTSNGITIKSAGNAYGASGVVQYVSLEGIPITMTYTADANGYHPVGDHIPKIPDYILRSLEYIRTHSTNKLNNKIK